MTQESNIAFTISDGQITPWSDLSEFTIKPTPVAPETDTLQDIFYTYDAVGNITKLEEKSGTSATKTAVYEYDDLYRLTKSTITDTIRGENYEHTYQYDSIGNITYKSDQGHYHYEQPGKTGPHAVTKITDDSGNTLKTFTYDANGNLIETTSTPQTPDPLKGENTPSVSVTKEFTWDYRNRLASSQITNELGFVTTVSYTYDHDVRRLSKTVSNDFKSETTEYPFPDYEITAEGKTKTSISANNMHLATVEISTVIASGARQSRTLFSHTDHLDGGNILTDINAEQVQTLDYYPFGEVRVDEQYTDFDETKKFTGHELDDSTGLIYAQARYYDPEIGRFISQDPLQWRPGGLMERFSRMPQALNYYSYTANNPIVLVDPEGEWCLHIAIGAAAGAFVGLGTQGLLDYSTGQFSGIGTYLGEAVGGAAAGAITVANPTVLGAVIAGGTGSVSASIIDQSIDEGQVSISQTIQTGSFGALTGLIPGINAGEISSITKQINTKFNNEQIKNISGTTTVKVFTGDVLSEVPGSFSENAINNMNYYQNTKTNLSEVPMYISMPPQYGPTKSEPYGPITPQQAQEQIKQNKKNSNNK